MSVPAVDAPEMYYWHEPITGVCRGYLNRLFFCSGELPFNQDGSLGSSRFGLANVVLLFCIVDFNCTFVLRL